MVFGFAKSASSAEIPNEGNSVVVGANRFAGACYQQLRETPGNLFFSPFSLSTALSMAAEGARGETATEMTSVLGFPAQPAARVQTASLTKQLLDAVNSDVELTSANAVWGQARYNWNPEYLGVVKRFYASELHSLSFADTEAARGKINAWVAEKTKSRIRDLIPQGALFPDTRMVLTNAVYFKAKWESAFEKDATSPHLFTFVSGMQKPVAMMRRTGSDLAYGETTVAQFLEVPYKNGQFSMVVALPKKGTDLTTLEKLVNGDNLSAWTKTLARREVTVFLPKFKVESNFKLKRPLEGVGIRLAFDRARADFSGMTESEPLVIDDVLHKAYVDVDESGTEAAAASAVLLAPKGIAPEPTPVFQADRPFLFWIRHRPTGVILFLGRVTEPPLA